jgi:hypothetical protein
MNTSCCSREQVRSERDEKTCVSQKGQQSSGVKCVCIIPVHIDSLREASHPRLYIYSQGHDPRPAKKFHTRGEHNQDTNEQVDSVLPKKATLFHSFWTFHPHLNLSTTASVSYNVVAKHLSIGLSPPSISRERGKFNSLLEKGQ